MKPKNWKDITLSQFIMLWEMQQDPNLEEIDKQVRLLSTVLNKSEDYILDLSLNQIKELTKQYSFVNNLPSEGEAKDFWAGGYKWKVNKNISKLTASDYINLSELLKDKDSIIKKLPEVLYIFCKPKYFIRKPDKERCLRLLGKASIGDVYPLSLFFCHLIIVLTGDSKDFLEKEVRQMMMKASQEIHSQNNGDGI